MVKLPNTGGRESTPVTHAKVARGKIASVPMRKRDSVAAASAGDSRGNAKSRIRGIFEV